MKPVCLVIGAGAGIGGNVGKRFAAGGYHTVLCRRSDEEGLQQLVAEIEAAGGSASGYLLNAIEEILYPAMEDYRLDIVIGEGPAARSRVLVGRRPVRKSHCARHSWNPLPECS